MTQESYGPIAAVRRVRDDAEALAVANALPFGLSAYVYSRQAPFGGWKLSALGRELGPEGLMAFREPKHIRMRLRSGSR